MTTTQLPVMCFSPARIAAGWPKFLDSSISVTLPWEGAKRIGFEPVGRFIFASIVDINDSVGHAKSVASAGNTAVQLLNDGDFIEHRNDDVELCTGHVSTFNFDLLMAPRLAGAVEAPWQSPAILAGVASLLDLIRRTDKIEAFAIGSVVIWR